ncbi:Cys-tRNA(Pro) deacylase [Rhodopseudomonas pseudopalustris]|uniref:Cys-tRNA(Pro)/Cys-tRNA(Cys) deacylase n=1 Tax=Rhodopseudomonas faecalis TaxID=99655 RepID=A0A318TDS7_9BRAD|nr:Cys-tRNA(Pro) deacylase [Rhodopseudomonas faecalis]PYF01990.1 Cys-tRNA(Pro)/Cys-tRNA(Cys) deacylase [Rhodopseudomonas faecalis]
MSKTTRATQALDKLKIDFTLHHYDYDPNADSIGLQAAAALGVPASCVLKTLMAEVDGKPVCVVVPSDREVSMKKLAGAFGGKSAKMMKPADAERLTGYHVGGISPFGQKKQLPTAVEQSALAEPLVYLNGGQRGLQIRLDPNALCQAIGARATPLVAD